MSHPNPLVSFVLLSYKQEQFIRKAVEGAFSQTYSPLEIIISDDASPDRTFAIIEEMAEEYQGPHTIILNRNEQNLGLGAHVAKIFGMSSGEWVIGAAGDDISLANRTSVILGVILNNPNAGGVWSSFDMIDQHGEPINVKKHLLHDTVVDHRKILEVTNGYPRRNPIHAYGCAAAWHRDVFSANEYIPESCQVEDLFSQCEHLRWVATFIILNSRLSNIELMETTYLEIWR